MGSKESISLEKLVEIMKDIQVPEEEICILSPEQVEYFKNTISKDIECKEANATIFGVPVVVSKFLPKGKFGLIPLNKRD